MHERRCSSSSAGACARCGESGSEGDRSSECVCSGVQAARGSAQSTRNAVHCDGDFVSRETTERVSSAGVSVLSGRGNSLFDNLFLFRHSEIYQTVSTLITQATAVPSSQVMVASALPSANVNPRAMKSYVSETTA